MLIPLPVKTRYFEKNFKKCDITQKWKDFKNNGTTWKLVSIAFKWVPMLCGFNSLKLPIFLGILILVTKVDPGRPPSLRAVHLCELAAPCKDAWSPSFACSLALAKHCNAPQSTHFSTCTDVVLSWCPRLSALNACRFNAGISSLRNSVQKRSSEAT
jgi:hypothetical protein